MLVSRIMAEKFCDETKEWVPKEKLKKRETSSIKLKYGGIKMKSDFPQHLLEVNFDKLLEDVYSDCYQKTPASKDMSDLRKELKNLYKEEKEWKKLHLRPLKDQEKDNLESKLKSLTGGNPKFNEKLYQDISKRIALEEGESYEKGNEKTVEDILEKKAEELKGKFVTVRNLIYIDRVQIKSVKKGEEFEYVYTEDMKLDIKEGLLKQLEICLGRIYGKGIFRNIKYQDQE